MLFFMSLMPGLTSGQNASPVSCVRIQMLCPATLVVPYCGPNRNLLTFSQVHMTADAVEIMVAQLFLCSCPEAITQVSK